MKSDHSRALQKPVQQDRNIAVSNEYFGWQRQSPGQQRQKLNRAEAAARAEDGADVAAPKKIGEIAGSLSGLPC
jgi:hypothetical protein